MSYLYFKENSDVKIRHSRIEEKKKIYEWLCLSDTTSLHLGEPNFPECLVPTWEEFLVEFQDYYFLEEGRNKASIMIIENNGVEIGCVVYKMFYLKQGCAELSIWLNSRKFIKKGFGSKAIEKVVNYLNREYSITQFLIRPSVKNFGAIKAYKKVGFQEVSNDDKDKVLKSFIESNFLSKYYDGEYGFNNCFVMIKSIRN